MTFARYNDTDRGLLLGWHHKQHNVFPKEWVVYLNVANYFQLSYSLFIRVCFIPSNRLPDPLIKRGMWSLPYFF